MRFLKVSAYYPEFVAFAKSKTQGLHQQPYEKQMEYLFSFSFGWSNFWKTQLENNNKASVIEILYNIDFVQHKWAEENGFTCSGKDWQNEILEAQIAFHKPEVIFFEDYLKPPIEYKRKFPFLKFIASWDGLAFKDTARYEGTDLIVSCHKGTVDYYNSQNIKSHLFLFGFEASILEKLIKRPAVYDASFVGSLNIYKNGHRQRLQLLDKAKEGLDLNYWISGAQPVSLTSILGMKYIVRGMMPDMLKLNKLLKGNRGQAFGQDMYQLLSDSRITLNSHIDAAGEYAANIRLFEATGVGTCLVTDWKKNMPELFDIDKEVVVYKSIEECVEKVKWLLNNKAECKKIAEAGQKKTREKYAFKSSVLRFFDNISY
jgi:spore maturation protein CgeB